MNSFRGDVIAIQYLKSRFQLQLGQRFYLFVDRFIDPQMEARFFCRFHVAVLNSLNRCVTISYPIDGKDRR